MGNENFRLRNLNVPHTIAITGVHVLAVFALLSRYFSWEGIILCVFLFWLSIWVGIGVCYHRLLTHASFKTPRWFRYVLTVISTLSWQGGPIVWVGRHRIHHQNSDKEGDPHSPNDGFSWAHVLWVLFRVSPEERKEVWRITGDLQRDKGIVFLNAFFWLPQVLLSVAIFWFGFRQGGFDTAFGWLVWGVGVRTVVGYHITWFVNSAAHTWGYQNFQTGDRSTNLWWVAFLSGGEGWHNNHHAGPRAAQHGGQKWFEIDLTYWTIRLLSLVGLAKDIVSFDTAKARL